MKPWAKAPPELIERFSRLATQVDGVVLRKMFGYPAGFVGGNLAFGVYADGVMVRLPAAECERLVADGWTQFEPMPGRTMRGYLTVPDEVLADDEQLQAWFSRAADHARGLPPK
jgi:TfoX/Sxy family transcriptional regulator of competence genes